VTKIALVTGASSGIGEATARRLAKDGFTLVLAARRRDRLDALARDLDVKTYVVSLDVTDRAAVASTLSSLPSDFAEFDVLVNSAGLSLGLDPAPKANLDDWDTMIATNVTGLAHVTRAILPGMVARDRGHVINLGSVAGSYPYPGGNAYGGTKAFVSQFSLNLRADLLGSRVRVTSIEPGMVETEFSEVRFSGDKDRAKAVYQGFQPLTGADIAEAIAWCVTQPPHVNVNRLELMPVMQSFSAFSVKRG
jgi:NADP-dependent 3-hydroxy acid dehydrogenase YdfG